MSKKYKCFPLKTKQYVYTSIRLFSCIRCYLTTANKNASFDFIILFLFILFVLTLCLVDSLVFTVFFFVGKAALQVIFYPNSFIYIRSRITAMNIQGSNDQHEDVITPLHHPQLASNHRPLLSINNTNDNNNNSNSVSNNPLPIGSNNLWKHVMIADAKPFLADNNVLLVTIFNVDPKKIPHLHQKVKLNSIHINIYIDLQLLYVCLYVFSTLRV